MQDMNSMHNLTHAAMEQLQSAFLECRHARAEGMILSALVTVKKVHDALLDVTEPPADLDPEELCCAV